MGWGRALSSLRLPRGRLISGMTTKVQFEGGKAGEARNRISTQAINVSATADVGHEADILLRRWNSYSLHCKEKLKRYKGDYWT